MFLDFVAERGTASAASNGTTVAATMNAAIPVGAVAIAVVAAEYLGALNAETAFVDTVTDPSGNTWTKVAEYSTQLNGSREGATIAQFFCVVETEIANGAAVTATWGATATARQISVSEWDKLDAENGVEVEGYTAAGSDGTATTTGSVTHTPASAEDLTWLGGGAIPESQGGTWIVDADFTTVTTKFTANGGNNTNNISSWSQYRQTANASETWDFTHSSSRMYALLLVGYRIVEPPPPPAEEGTREYQADFETENHAVVDASTERRVDGILPDPRLAYCMGPVDVDDVSSGLEVRRWRARADDDGNIWLARSNAGNSAWEAEELFAVYTPSGAPILELGVAFTEEGRVVLCAERADGTLGASRVHLYWYHPSWGFYLWETVGNGNSPRVISDYFPVGDLADFVCPPEIDVQLFYMKDGAGLKRREESDLFDTDFDTVLGWNAETRLLCAYKTEGRRISLAYTERNATLGQLTLRRTDSVPYNDSLIRRPLFVNWSDPGADLYQVWDELARTSPYEEDDLLALRIQVQDDCDAIELEFASTYPEGIEPTFGLDQQEYVAALSAGDTHDFSVYVDHGDGALSHVAARARVRRTIDSVTCYSPWRYIVCPLAWPLATGTDVLVNCDRDMMIDVPSRDVWIRDGRVDVSRETNVSARTDPTPYVCTTGTAYDETDTLPGAGPYAFYVFAGGVLNTTPSYPFPTHLINYQWARRPVEGILFVDEAGILHKGTVVGAQMETGASGNGGPALGYPTTRYPKQFPDDDGTFPLGY